MKNDIELLLSESTRDYGYIILTVVINGVLCELRRYPKQDYNRLKNFNIGEYEKLRFDIINQALTNHFKGVTVNDQF
jgi:hypothetical protein